MTNREVHPPRHNQSPIRFNGRHNRAAGFNADLEKYLEAGLAGWRAFRLGPDWTTMENVERPVQVILIDSGGVSSRA